MLLHHEGYGFVKEFENVVLKNERRAEAVLQHKTK